jgi:hypothetical protein
MTGFCCTLRGNFGGWAASVVDALSLRVLASSADVLDARELFLLPAGVDSALMRSFLTFPTAEAASSSSFTFFILVVVGSSSSMYPESAMR